MQEDSDSILDSCLALNIDLNTASHSGSDHGPSFVSDSDLDARRFRFYSRSSDSGLTLNSNFDRTLDFNSDLILDLNPRLDFQLYFSSCAQYRFCYRYGDLSQVTQVVSTDYEEDYDSEEATTPFREKSLRYEGHSGIIEVLSSAGFPAVTIAHACKSTSLQKRAQ
ncbi:hypothetical protein EVAR_44870_1 [Eumeta japonica]|uniref:Uncharacterized protein n=1 Tax=Eumeta variegata TaxID=151549 RepID=A0A4C1Y8Q1_EUMVA|nr:hypothetical protein EVAR_44870_1 [Eumeta japonica]